MEQVRPGREHNMVVNPKISGFLGALISNVM